MLVQLYFINKTKDARHYWKTKPDGDRVKGVNDVWIPRQFCERTIKFPVDRRHEIEVTDWFANKYLTDL